MASADKIIKERYIDELNIYENFNPYRIKENIEPFMGGIPIIFMTTPSMTIFEGGKIINSLLDSNPIFSLLNETDPIIIKNLQYNGGGSTSPFIKIATNRFKGLSLKDFNMQTVEEHQNYYGWKQILPSTTVDNFTAESSLNINFAETKSLDMTKLFYSWMCYIEAVRYGLHEPNQKTRDNRILDFTSSVYFFLLDFDMRTILYFCKYTGVYPTNVPLGNLVMGDITSKAPIDTSMTFVYQYKEEMNPQIIYDFNIVAGNPGEVFKHQGIDAVDNGANNTASVLSGYGDFNRYNPEESKLKINNNNIIPTDDGRDFIYNKNYNTVQIKTMVESDYDNNNQTSFNSSENSNKKTLIMDFISNNHSSGIAGSFNASNYINDYTTQKYQDLQRKIKSQASDILGELSIGLIGEANKKQYDDYLIEKRKELGISEEDIQTLKDSYKEKMDNEEITEEDYKLKLEEIDTMVESKIKNNVLDYSSYKNSEEYKNAVRTKNYLDAVINANKAGTTLPGMEEYYSRLKSDNSNKASKAADEFIKLFGTWID